MYGFGINIFSAVPYLIIYAANRNYAYHKPQKSTNSPKHVICKRTIASSVDFTGTMYGKRDWGQHRPGFRRQISWPTRETWLQSNATAINRGFWFSKYRSSWLFCVNAHLCSQPAFTEKHRNMWLHRLVHGRYHFRRMVRRCWSKHKTSWSKSHERHNVVGFAFS